MYINITIILAIWCFIIHPSYADALHGLELDRQVSTEGFITVSWQNGAASSPHELQVAHDPSFENLTHKINMGQQTSVHLSGLRNGRYYVRFIDENAGLVSGPASFVVEHRQFDHAIKLFFVGAALFTFLLVTLIRFSNKA